MDEQRVFVGRQAELDRFRQILEDPRGQAVVVVGQAGMGKTWLIDRMDELATQHSRLKCGWVRYEVTPTDSVDATMELMMDNAFEAAKTCEGSFDNTDHRRKQWAALFKTFVPKGGDIAELYASLRRDPQKHAREQFLERLRLISTRMGPDGRALFVVDPDKYMCQGCADSWRLVTRELPEKVKFLFAQRPDDELVNSNSFMALDNVMRLPRESLGVLAAEEVDDLVRLRADDVGQAASILQDAVNRYRGHPYAIQAALGIVQRTKQVGDLPQDPTPEAIAATQWRQVCRTGDDAIRLFEAYAILDAAVPHDIVRAVSGLETVAMKRLLSDLYLRGLLREEGQGKRIYHALLADHVRGQIDPAQQQALHTRAILVYRTSLKEAREQHKAPDGLAAVRLPEHILATEQPSVFVQVFVHECTGPLLNLGLLDAAIEFSRRSLELVEKGTNEEAAILGNQAVILQARGDLDGGMALLKEAERICRQLGNLKGLGQILGNRALILKARGDLDGAMALHKEEERICRQLGNLDGLQATLGNQALILKARGDLDGAMALHKEEERICHQLGNLDGLQATLGNQALILQARGDLDGAIALLKKTECLCRQLGNLNDLQRTFGNQAGILTDCGDLDGALAFLKEQERVCRQLGNPEGLAISLANQASIHLQKKQACEALTLAEQAHQLAVRHGYARLVKEIEPILDKARRAARAG